MHITYVLDKKTNEFLKYSKNVYESKLNKNYGHKKLRTVTESFFIRAILKKETRFEGRLARVRIKDGDRSGDRFRAITARIKHDDFATLKAMAEKRDTSPSALFAHIITQIAAKERDAK